MSRLFGDPAPSSDSAAHTVQSLAQQPVNQEKVEQQRELERRRQLSEENLRQIDRN
jgi:hypothetical protein